MGFAHRGLHGPAVPENSLTAFEAALAIGAGIECDLRLTADGVPIVFHDRDARRLCGDPLICAAASLAEIGRLKLWKTDQRVPVLAELLDLVDGRVPLLLELKVERNAARFAAACVAVLRGYPGPVGVMSFSAGVGQWLVRHHSQTRRGLVLSERDSLVRRWSKMRRADPQFLAVKWTELGQPWAHRARAARPLYAWTIRDADARATSMRAADAAIWEADGRP